MNKAAQETKQAATGGVPQKGYVGRKAAQVRYIRTRQGVKRVVGEQVTVERETDSNVYVNGFPYCKGGEISQVGTMEVRRASAMDASGFPLIPRTWPRPKK